MSTKHQFTNQGENVLAVQPLFTTAELTTLLIKHHDYHEGLFDLLIEFQIGVGAVPTTPPAPGAVIAVSRIGLSVAKNKGPTTVNAAEVNPLRPAKPKRIKKSPK